MVYTAVGSTHRKFNLLENIFLPIMDYYSTDPNNGMTYEIYNHRDI
jgi:hypothetical protein